MNNQTITEGKDLRTLVERMLFLDTSSEAISRKKLVHQSNPALREKDYNHLVEEKKERCEKRICEIREQLNYSSQSVQVSWEIHKTASKVPQEAMDNSEVRDLSTDVQIGYILDYLIYEFEVRWCLYPKPVAKQIAQERYFKERLACLIGRTPGATAEAFLEAVRNYRGFAVKTGREWKFLIGAPNFFGERWRDWTDENLARRTY